MEGRTWALPAQMPDWQKNWRTATCASRGLAYPKEESGELCQASGAKCLDTGGEDTKGPKLGKQR